MIERTQIGFPRLENGKYEFTVLKPPVKKKTAKSTFRQWELGVVKDQQITQKIQITLFPWESEGLLLALGGKKEGHEIVWDDTAVEGKYFEAEISSEKYTNKDGEIKEKYVLKNCEKSF